MLALQSSRLAQLRISAPKVRLRPTFIQDEFRTPHGEIFRSLGQVLGCVHLLTWCICRLGSERHTGANRNKPKNQGFGVKMRNTGFMDEQSSEQDLNPIRLSRVHPEWETVAAAQALVDQLANQLYALPLEEFRKTSYKPPRLPENVPLPGVDITIEEGSFLTADGTELGLRIYRPIQALGIRPLFFNVHGGGWTVGTPQTEEAQNRWIAVANGAVVVSVDYRRAPEYPFPHALNDCLDALLWCKTRASTLNIDDSRIVIGGGSAGANICAVLSQIARDTGICGIIGQMLNIPVTCHPDHFPKSLVAAPWSYEQNANAPIVSAERMRTYWKNYHPTASLDPRASPLLSGNLTNLPPALIQVAGMDPLRDDGLAYVDALRANGVHVTLKVWAGLPHAFYVYPELEASKEYYNVMTEWLSGIFAGMGNEGVH